MAHLLTILGNEKHSKLIEATAGKGSFKSSKEVRDRFRAPTGHPVQPKPKSPSLVFGTILWVKRDAVGVDGRSVLT